ncbi:hypothetical protein LXL04_018714 [Taraxacum kok-saghyz]
MLSKTGEGEWHQVRRRKQPPARDLRGSSSFPITSFYVSNLSGDACRKDLWKPCFSLGKLVDIYFAGRRDFSGFFFGFFRYENPTNADKIIEGLNKISCRGRKLVASYAKHPRVMVKPAPKRHHVEPQRNVRPANRGARSFADVAKGVAETPAMIPVNLSITPEITAWGEKRFDIVEIKYLGGMQVLLQLKSSSAAEAFINNKSIWMKWFRQTSIYMAGSQLKERITWLKITGLPIHAWDDANFASIAGRFGKLLVSGGAFWNLIDVSHGKICVLTSSLTKLNEELLVSLGGPQFKIGVFEIEDSWEPFSPFAENS